MKKSLILLITALCFLGCATPRNERIDPGATSANLQERISPDEARRRILGPLEADIAALNARLTQDLSKALREQLITDRDLLERQLARSREKLDIQLATFNPATDQIWTFRTPALSPDGRRGESGIVLIQGTRTTYLQKITHD
jgi:hypothetical protein